MHTINVPLFNDSPFLNLPPELRHRIFYLSHLPSSASTQPSIIPAAGTYLSLQLTSRLVSNETHLLPFHAFPLVLPCNFGSSATALLQSLRKMKKRQIHAIRTVEVSVLGSVYEAEEAGRVVRALRDGTEDGRNRWNRTGLSSDIAVAVVEGGRWGERMEVNEHKGEYEEDESGSGLRELTLTITARDVLAPMTESAAGMERMLDLETSPFFIEVAKGLADGVFHRLRSVIVTVELGPSLKRAYLKEDVEEWEHKLWLKLNPVSLGQTDSDGDGKGGKIGEAQHSRMGVKVYTTFKPCPLTSGAEYFAALGGDEGWWIDSTSATSGWTGTSYTIWGGVGVALSR